MRAISAELHTSRDIAAFVDSLPRVRRLLEAVEACALPDGWIGAGTVRNAVWNHLHGFDADIVAGGDVDVVFFDAADATAYRDASIEAQLRVVMPGIHWQVRNQARMHEQNGDPPYRDTEDAIRCWPETATAIGARLAGGRVEIMAPHGVTDLVQLVVRPTPVFSHKPDVYRARLAAKGWDARWPKLRFKAA